LAFEAAVQANAVGVLIQGDLFAVVFGADADVNILPACRPNTLRDRRKGRFLRAIALRVVAVLARDEDAEFVAGPATGIVGDVAGAGYGGAAAFAAGAADSQ